MNALQVASLEGHSAIGRLWLEQGAVVNAHGGSYGDALQMASLKVHKVIFRLLLQESANVNSTRWVVLWERIAGGVVGGSRCHRLVALGARRVCERSGGILWHSTAGGEYGNALQAASLNGHDAIVSDAPGEWSGHWTRRVDYSRMCRRQRLPRVEM